MGLDRTPDAVIFPAGTFNQTTPAERVNAVQKTFGQVLSKDPAKPVRTYFSEQGNLRFVTRNFGHVGAELLFPEGHPRAKDEAYVWFVAVEHPPGTWSLADPCESLYDHADQVKFGFRKPDEHAGSKDVQAAIAKAAEKRVAEHNTPERARARIKILQDQGILTKEEYQSQLDEIDAKNPPPDDKPAETPADVRPAPDVEAPIGAPVEPERP
jgi:hypothetical protein